MLMASQLRAIFETLEGLKQASAFRWCWKLGFAEELAVLKPPENGDLFERGSESCLPYL